MANSLRFIKDVNHVDTANNLQVLFQFILGSKTPNKHDISLAYKKGDFVYSYNSTEKQFHVFMAIQDVPELIEIDSTTYWQRMSLKDLISEGTIALGKTEDIITISEIEPTKNNNRVWLKPLREKSFDPGVVEDKYNISLIFNGEQIAAQDDEPDNPDIKLWFDYEFDHEGKPLPLKLDETEYEINSEENDSDDFVIFSGSNLNLSEFDDFE